MTMIVESSNRCVCCGAEIPEGSMVCPDCANGEVVDYMHKLSYSVQSLVYPSMNSNPDGISADLFFRGCKRHCPGCHNLELQSFTSDNTSLQSICDAIESNDVKIITLMGGEPLDVEHGKLRDLLYELTTRFPDLKISMFTGHKLEEVPQFVFYYLDYIKVGMYDKNQLSPFGSFLASTNQHFYKITKKCGDKVYLREYTNNKHYVNEDYVLSFNK